MNDIESRCTLVVTIAAIITQGQWSVLYRKIIIMTTKSNCVRSVLVLVYMNRFVSKKGGISVHGDNNMCMFVTGSCRKC